VAIQHLLRSVFLATILMEPQQVLAIPCATDSANYRNQLLKEKWMPVAAPNNIASYTEISTGTRIATAQ
jgi:hypothetical protein